MRPTPWILAALACVSCTFAGSPARRGMGIERAYSAPSDDVAREVRAFLASIGAEWTVDSRRSEHLFTARAMPPSPSLAIGERFAVFVEPSGDGGSYVEVVNVSFAKERPPGTRWDQVVHRELASRLRR